MAFPIRYSIRVPSLDVTVPLQELAGRRLWFALRRFEDKVRRVTVRLIDVNGPRRGIDTRCTIQAELVDSSMLVAEATSAWPTAAITHACRRLNTAMRRHVSRTRARMGDAAHPPAG